MRLLLLVFTSGLLFGLSARLQAQAPSDVDPKALCRHLAAEPGERKQTGLGGNRLFEGFSGAAACTVRIRDTSSGTVALSLVGLPDDGDACDLLERARTDLARDGMVETPIDLPKARRAVAFRSKPAKNPLVPIVVGAVLACGGWHGSPFLVVGTAMIGAGSDIAAEMALLERRARDTLARLGPVRTLATSEFDFGWGLSELPEAVADRFKGAPGGISQAYRDAADNLPRGYAGTNIRPWAIMAGLRYPDGTLVAPALGRVLPVMERLAEKAEHDPDAGVAMRRFGSLVLRMAYRASSSDSAATSPTPP